MERVSETRPFLPCNLSSEKPATETEQPRTRGCAGNAPAILVQRNQQLKLVITVRVKARRMACNLSSEKPATETGHNGRQRNRVKPAILVQKVIFQN